MVFHWSLSDTKSPQVSRILLGILADLNNVVVWMISSCPQISKLSSAFTKPFQANRQQLVSPTGISGIFVNFQLKFLIISFSEEAEQTFWKNIKSAEINILTKICQFFKGFSFLWHKHTQRESTPQSRSCTTIYHPSRKLSKLDEPNMREIPGEVRRGSLLMYFCGAIHMDQQRQEDQHELT